MVIQIDDFDKLEERLESLEIKSDYFPTSEDLDEMENDDRYAAFLLYLYMHHREPENEEESAVLKRLSAMKNKAIELDFEGESV